LVGQIIKELLNIGHLSTAYHTNFILMGTTDLQNDLEIDVSWHLYGTGPGMISAFKMKQLDIGYMGLTPAIIGIDQGVPIKCVAGGHVEGTIMIGKKVYNKISQLNHSMEKVLAQFKGKSIGVPSKGSIHDVIIRHYIEKNDLHEEIKVKNYGQPEYIALDMKKNVLDGGVGTPSLAIFASTLFDSHIVIPPENLWSNNPSYGIFFHENIINEHPDVVTKFLSHHKKASFLIRNSPLKAAEIISKIFKIIDKNFVQSVLEISPKYCIALSQEYINSTMNFMKVLYNLGYSKRLLKISEIFNFDFMKKIHPENHHYYSKKT